MHWMRAVAVVFALMMFAGGGQALASEQEITNSSENLRTGWYPETGGITPQLVSGGTFGELWSTPVEGQVYAQPLLDKGTLLVATEKNMVYGLNSETGSPTWSRSLLGEPWSAAEIGCGDLAPDVGVTATPVINAATGIAYLTHKAYVSGKSGPSQWYMDALNVATGAEQPGFPVPLSGVAQNAPDQEFEAKTELQRPGLLLLEGVVYAGFGSDCDDDPYEGWVFGVAESGAVKARWTAEAEGWGSGVWQSGAGIMSDGPGTMLVSTGNGGVPADHTSGFEPPGNLGESIVRLRVQPDGELKATDFFAPFNAEELSSWDADFASGGVTGLPNEYFGTKSFPHLAVAVGKDGYVYLLNRDELGGIGEGLHGADKVVQQIGPYGGVWSRPGVWPGEGGWVYIPTASDGTSASGSSGNLRVYQYGVSGTGSPTLSLQGTSKDAFGFSSSAPVITSEGTTPGSALVWIVWAPNGTGEGAQLRAYNPTPEHGEPILRWSAPIGTSAKFATPGIGDGRLYVGTRDGHVLAFGSPVTPALAGKAVVFKTITDGQSETQTAILAANESLTVEKLESSSGQFTLGTPKPALPATLNKGQMLEVPVTFKPAGTGPLGATLSAKTVAGRTGSVSLSGTGRAKDAQLEATPTVVAFEPTAVGESVSAAATFRNVGGAPLAIESVGLPGAPFAAEGAPEPPSTIEQGQSITITIDFSPTKVGDFDGEITLQTSAGTGTVHLSGNAGPPGELQLAGVPGEFGDVSVGSTATRTFTVSNIGGTAVTVFKSKPPSGGEFSPETGLPEGTTIAPGETRTEAVVFAPTSTGPAEDVWLINGNGTSGLLEAHFAGVGVTPGGPGTTQPTSLTQQIPGLGVSAFQTSVLPNARLVGPTTLRASASGTIYLKLSCPAGVTRCTGTVSVRSLRAIIAPGSKSRKPWILTLASGSFAINGGKVATLKLHLTGAARALLARKRLLREQATILSRVTTATAHTTHAIVTILAYEPKRRSQG
jgi:hypothetical protein